MTPERRAAILENHRPKPNRDYTDCGDCFEGWPCETAEAMAELAAAVAQVAALRAALALVDGAFTSGIYCSNCGESLDDGCLTDCVIGQARAALAGGTNW